MFRLVARQWQTLSGSRTATGTLRLPTPPPRASARLFRTWPAASDRPLAAIQALNSAILIPGSVKDTQPDDLINYINPVPHEHVAANTFCVLLVTPAFSSWLLQDDIFVAKAIRRAYSKASTAPHQRLTIQSLCAVVDKLPAGRAFQPEVSLKDEVAQRSRVPPVGESGFEGVAFITLPADASFSSTSPRSPEKGAIDFAFSGPGEGHYAFSDTWRLPLANTVFHTGVPTTMFLSTWDFQCQQKHLELVQRADVTHHGISATASVDIPRRHVSALSTPLMALTFPRKVEGCMGNIIRSVIGSEGESVTASSELERVVPQFFKARGEQAQPTTAWALILPKSKLSGAQQRTRKLLSNRLSSKEKASKSQITDELWERTWKHSDSWNRLVPIALAEGARLHRVLSGGGGWGKKAGLLSLDPVPINEEIPIRMEDATSDFDGPGDFSTALTPVVGDGDSIQFFISPTSLPNQAAAEETNKLELLKSLPKDGSCGWELGTVPSTVDSMPGGSWQHDGSDSKYVAVFRNTFGALAEGGMTLTRRIQVKREEPLSVVATTTVDVPYSRFWTAQLADGQGASKDFKSSWQSDSKNLMVPTARQRVRHTRSDVELQSTSHSTLSPVLSRLKTSVDRLSCTPQFVNSQNMIPDSPSPISIRRITSRGTLESKLTAERFYQICAAITAITEDHKHTIHNLRQRRRQRSKIDNLRSQTLLHAQHPQRRHVVYREHIDKFPVYVDESNILVGSLQLATKFAVKNPSRLPDVTSKTSAETPQTSIRRFVSGRPVAPKINTGALAAKMRHMCETVALLAKQYKTITFKVQQRINRHDKFVLVKQEKRERAFSSYLNKELNSKQKNTSVTNNIPRDNTTRDMTRHRAKVIIRRRTAVPQQKFDKLQAGVVAVQEELRRTLRYIDRLAWYTHAANKSAFEVYGIHIALRLRLGKMIVYRWKRLVHRTGDHENKLGIQRLEMRLVKLRAYNNVLFSTRPGRTPQEISEELGNIEMQNQVQRALVLITRIGGRLRGRRLLEKRKHRKSSNEGNVLDAEGQLKIRYRRVRNHEVASPKDHKSRSKPQGVVRYMPLHRLRTVTWRPSRRADQTTSDSRTRFRPKSREMTAAEKRKKEKKLLVDAVGSWLGGGAVDNGAAMPDGKTGGRKRPFGSRAVVKDDEETEGEQGSNGRKRMFGSRAIRSDGDGEVVSSELETC